jgi:hypothetical protein
VSLECDALLDGFDHLGNARFAEIHRGFLRIRAFEQTCKRVDPLEGTGLAPRENAAQSHNARECT